MGTGHFNTDGRYANSFYFSDIDKEGYFSKRKEACSLQDRWKNEAGVDVIQRVVDSLHRVTGMPVRLAREDDKEYFAGILRAVSHGIHVHADYAPYVSSSRALIFFCARSTRHLDTGFKYAQPIQTSVANQNAKSNRKLPVG